MTNTTKDEDKMRKRRFKRAPEKTKPFVLQKGDILIIIEVFKNRFLTSEHIISLFPESLKHNKKPGEEFLQPGKSTGKTGQSILIFYCFYSTIRLYIYKKIPYISRWSIQKTFKE